MDYSAYFLRAEAKARALATHDLPPNPTDEDVLAFAIDQAERIDALCGALGIKLVTDPRGRYRVMPAEVM